MAPPTMTWLTHASLWLEGAGTALLTDPFFVYDPYAGSHLFHYPPHAFDPAALGPVPFLFSSHAHEDHCHLETLAALRPQVGRVLLPAERPDLRARYAGLGYEDVTLLANGERMELAPGLAVTCVWDGPIDSVLVAEVEGQTVLHQNDCMLRPETVEALAARFRVDWACMCYTMAQDLYPLLLDRPVWELDWLAAERELAWAGYQGRVARALKPRGVIPYSMTMTYHQPDQRHLNGHGRLIPPTFAATLGRFAPEVLVAVLHPGDALDLATGAVTPGPAGPRWGDDLAAYLANVDAYADQAGFAPFEPGAVADVAAALEAHLAGREAPVELVVTGRDGERRFRAGDGEPEVVLTMPAAVAGELLRDRHDPFTSLFTYRIRARWRAGHGFGPYEEVQRTIDAVCGLFAAARP